MDGIVNLILFLGFYAFGSYTSMVIANKLNVPNAWLAWIPLLSVWVFVKSAGKPWWWILLLFVPLVNIVCFLIMIFAIPPRLGKPALWGLIMFLPIIGYLVYYGLLAFT
jgi:hypothetical protein